MQQFLFETKGLLLLIHCINFHPESTVAITRSVAELFAGFHTGIMKVVATRDSDHQSSTEALPSVLAHSPAAIHTSELCEVLCPRRVRLEKTSWTKTEIDQIEEDHRKSRRVANSRTHFKDVLGNCSDVKTRFEKGWALCRRRFDKLQLFAGSLASMFPNTVTVESDFLIMGAKKNVYRQSLTEISLEGVLQARKFETPCSMSTGQTPFRSFYKRYTAIFRFPPYSSIKTLFDTTIGLIVILLRLPTIKVACRWKLREGRECRKFERRFSQLLSLLFCTIWRSSRAHCTHRAGATSATRALVHDRCNMVFIFFFF